MATTVGPPAEHIGLSRLRHDPYPAYRYLREHDPVAWVPEAGRHLVTRHADIMRVERSPEIFLSSEDPSSESPSLMTRSIGEALLRQDGDAHRRLRRAAEPPLRPRVVKEHWLPVFRRNTRDLLSGLAARGSGDLFADFAGPLAARNLAALLGLRGVGDDDMLRWSQAIIDAGGNYGEDPEIWARCARAVAELDAAMDEILPALRRDPDPSVVSAMLHADDPLTEGEIRTNVRVFLGGGLKRTPRFHRHRRLRPAHPRRPAARRRGGTRPVEAGVRGGRPLGLPHRHVSAPGGRPH
ncbi:cytochrome P450 [Streptomyces adelaidensis]|uniref:cytochrome P450 n=1 Tax=Streptomyces adelaidensis TaxID=2796465 RepID=UPI0019039756|nr:cytochrome P450 [Streptomyces adelaidensis]